MLAQTGDQYLYQLQLEDLNEEKYFGFELTVAPTGMQIDEEGLLRWLPSDTQLDSQYVTVSVSDGFETVSRNSPSMSTFRPSSLKNLHRLPLSQKRMSGSTEDRG